jgi:mitogen-activated protein kinase kinase
VHGEPPTLPDDFSDNAHAFIRACLDKNPNNRPSYAQLLRHPWLAPLLEPPTEPTPSNEAQSPSSDQSAEPSPQPSPNETEDVEVAAWVTGALERLRHATKEFLQKPALHAVALDAVGGSPLLEKEPKTIPPTM